MTVLISKVKKSEWPAGGSKEKEQVAANMELEKSKLNTVSGVC